MKVLVNLTHALRHSGSKAYPELQRWYILLKDTTPDSFELQKMYSLQELSVNILYMGGLVGK